MHRILTPSEYTLLRDAIPRSKDRILVDTLLNSGARYSELVAFSEHLAWFDVKNRVISIPEGYTKTSEARVVHLTPAFSHTLSQYLREFKTLDFPTRDGMNKNLRSWWNATFLPMTQTGKIGYYPSVKTFRKTWESWLLSADLPYMKVCLSQGHSPQISYNYYANLPPELKSEMERVRKMVDGWGT